MTKSTPLGLLVVAVLAICGALFSALALKAAVVRDGDISRWDRPNARPG